MIKRKSNDQTQSVNDMNENDEIEQNDNNDDSDYKMSDNEDDDNYDKSYDEREEHIKKIRDEQRKKLQQLKQSQHSQLDANDQKRMEDKVKYLLQQTELYSHFMSRGFDSLSSKLSKYKKQPSSKNHRKQISEKLEVILRETLEDEKGANFQSVKLTVSPSCLYISMYNV